MACAAHMWQLMCMVITIWWRLALMCGSHVVRAAHIWQLMCMVLLYGGGEPSCVAINVHSNYYMVERSPHVWLTCGNLSAR